MSKASKLGHEFKSVLLILISIQLNVCECSEDFGTTEAANKSNNEATATVKYDTGTTFTYSIPPTVEQEMEASTAMTRSTMESATISDNDGINVTDTITATSDEIKTKLMETTAVQENTEETTTLTDGNMITTTVTGDTETITDINGLETTVEENPKTTVEENAGTTVEGNTKRTVGENAGTTVEGNTKRTVGENAGTTVGESEVSTADDVIVNGTPISQLEEATTTENSDSTTLGDDDEETTSTPQEDLSIHVLVERQGYLLEDHFITTEDGYILLVHRITGSKGESSNETKPVVLLVHTASSSAVQWVMGNSSTSLGLSLSDNGFDVWMLNNRGNSYSRNHTKFDPNEKEFWNFSFDEMGEFDIPATIDYIINKTGVSKINYVGHSMGTTVFLIAMSLKPNYNDKINHMIAWAPLVFMNGVSKAIRMYAKTVYKLKDTVDSFNETGEVFNRNSTKLRESMKVFQHFPTMVTSYITKYSGGKAENFNQGLFSTMIQHFPDGFPFKALLHYCQLLQSGMFRRYDEGWKNNLARYKHTSPPSYNLRQVTTSVTLVQAQNDLIATTADTMELMNSLTHTKHISLKSTQLFGHLSYLTSFDAGDQIIEPTVRYLLKYNNMTQVQTTTESACRTPN